ncbi:type II toxin-antitoxin system HicB family antitoxin [Candidatus Kaiserbacteria bacterium]|nr:type II toxin-antitoxin system HicB family antitoxin [Candidatus Kaiserbacteria bacterium]
MKHIIQFHISRGDTKYVAQGVELPIVTQADTLDELAENIKEATALHLEGEDFSSLGLAPSPTVLVNFELDTPMHA